MVLTVKELREKLEKYDDDLEVSIFVGGNGKQRRINYIMDIITTDFERTGIERVTGVAIEVEK